jgi:hypothetical protein
MEAACSSETLVLASPIRRHIPEGNILEAKFLIFSKSVTDL